MDEIAAPKLAIDGEIEKGKVSGTLGQLQSDPDRPDLSEFQWGFRPDQSALVPRIVVGADLGIYVLVRVKLKQPL